MVRIGSLFRATLGRWQWWNDRSYDSTDAGLHVIFARCGKRSVWLLDLQHGNVYHEEERVLLGEKRDHRSRIQNDTTYEKII